MKEYIPIVTAVIALIGSVIGLILGYRKWRKEHHAKKFGQFDKDKQEVYKALWNRVEEFNIKVRKEYVDPKDFSEHIQNLNAFLLKNGIYIDDEDRELANNYAEAVFNFQKVVKDSNIKEANVFHGDTREIPDHIIKQAKDIGNAQERALKLRGELLSKIRRVLSGT